MRSKVVRVSITLKANTKQTIKTFVRDLPYCTLLDEIYAAISYELTKVGLPYLAPRIFIRLNYKQAYCACVPLTKLNYIEALSHIYRFNSRVEHFKVFAYCFTVPHYSVEQYVMLLKKYCETPVCVKEAKVLQSFVQKSQSHSHII